MPFVTSPLISTFDWSTISDVVLHVQYTAREGGELLRESALQSIDVDLTVINLELISIKLSMADEWARLANTTGNEDYLLSVNLGLINFPYYLRDRGITITNLEVALSGDVSVDGWDDIKLPDIINESNEPYVETFELGETLGLATASFDFELLIESEADYISVKLPQELINEVSGVVKDIFMICSYSINEVSSD